jgi:alpha-tubulin suppressor-like RCC1 family protein
MTESRKIFIRFLALSVFLFRASDIFAEQRVFKETSSALIVPDVVLLGNSLVTNECFTPFNDPGAIARYVTQPVDGGDYFSIALRADGTAAAWGQNNQGQTGVPAAATNLVAVTAGAYHALGLRPDGTLIGWGSDYYGQASIPAEAHDVIAISAGYSYNLALRADGAVVAWGWDFGGATNVPAGATNVVAIAAGDAHGLVLRANGTVVAWGLNNTGQTDVPTSATNIVAIAAGAEHSLALRQDGQVIVWGSSTQPPAEATNIVAIAGGFGFCLALGADGTLFSWGTNEPGVPADATNIIAITAGKLHAFALRRDGTGIAWGNNSHGQCDVPAGLTGNTSGRVIHRTAFNPGVLGAHTIYYSVTGAFGGTAAATRTVVVRDTTPPALTLNGDNPMSISTPENYVEPGATASDLCAGVASIAGGWYHNLALKSAGSVTAWGRNDQGQCNIPTDATNTVAMAAGGPYSASLQTDGRVLVNGSAGGMWGDPTPPADATNLVAVSVGGAHLLGLRADGTVRAWGYNGSGQTDVPTDATNAVAIATGNNFSMALRADGTVRAWGSNFYGESSPPAIATNIIAIAAGEVTALALKADGTVIGWGDDSMGQISAPPSLSNVVAISCGARQSLALQADGTVVAWGSFAILTNIPPNVPNAVAISCGYFHNLALLATGKVVFWGVNDYGQGNVPDTLSDTLTNLTVTGTLTGVTNLLTYTAVDASGNTGTVQRTVIVTSIPPTPLTITKQAAKVSFVKPLADSTSFTANIGLPDDFAPSNQVVTVDIGGVVAEFTLDAKGKCKLLAGSCALKKNKLGGWIITVKLKKGDFAALWNDEGLTNETITDKRIEMAVSVTVNGQVFTGAAPMLYKAKQEKSGAAKLVVETS